MMKITAIKIFEYNIHNTWTPIPIPMLVTVISNVFKFLEISLNTLDIGFYVGCVRSKK